MAFSVRTFTATEAPTYYINAPHAYGEILALPSITWYYSDRDLETFLDRDLWLARIEELGLQLPED